MSLHSNLEIVYISCLWFRQLDSAIWELIFCLRGIGNANHYHLFHLRQHRGGSGSAAVGMQVPAKPIRFVQIANPWPHHTVCFNPILELPLCLSSSSTLASGPSMWITLHSLQSEPHDFTRRVWSGHYRGHGSYGTCRGCGR